MEKCPKCNALVLTRESEYEFSTCYNGHTIPRKEKTESLKIDVEKKFENIYEEIHAFLKKKKISTFDFDYISFMPYGKFITMKGKYNDEEFNKYIITYNKLKIFYQKEGAKLITERMNALKLRVYNFLRSFNISKDDYCKAIYDELNGKDSKEYRKVVEALESQEVYTEFRKGAYRNIIKKNKVTIKDVMKVLSVTQGQAGMLLSRGMPKIHIVKLVDYLKSLERTNRDSA